MEKKRLIIICAAAAVLLLALVLIFVFVILPLLTSNKEEEAKLFDIASVDIMLNGEVIQNLEVEIESESVLTAKVNDGADLSGYDAPKITWSFEGESLGSKIDPNGKFTAGKIGGEVTLVASAKSKNELQAKIKIFIINPDKLFEITSLDILFNK